MFKTARIKFLSRFLLCKRCNSTWSYPFKTRSYKITHTPWLFKRFETISSFTLYQIARLFARYDMQKKFIHVWSKYLPMFYRTSQFSINRTLKCYGSRKLILLISYSLNDLKKDEYNPAFGFCTVEYVSSLIGIYRQ